MKHIYKNLYFLLVFLATLPYYISLPFLPSLHTFIGIFIFVLSFILCVRMFRQKKKLKIDRTFTFVILFFLLSQSLSIIPAENIPAFIGVYKYFILALLFLVISYLTIQGPADIRKIIYILFAVAGINGLLQLVVLIYPGILTHIGSYLFDQNFYEMIKANLFRGRIPIQTFDEILIPLLFYGLFYSKDTRKGYFYILIASIFVFSFLSGFRTKILMIVLSLIGSVYVFRVYFKRYLPLLMGLIVLFVALYAIVSLSILKDYDTGFDRLLTTSGNLNQATSGRLDIWSQAMQLGLNSPIFGVGLGNYVEYVSPQRKNVVTLFQSNELLASTASLDPHSILFSTFAETGLIGLFGFILLVLYFIKRDLALFMSPRNNLARCFAVSFWTLFTFSLLNPSYLFTYQILFWLLRILIEKSVTLNADELQKV